jgi:ATP-dependent helicase/nuclease subunit A
MSAALGNDRAARARAIDPSGSFIVQAPAGSGKTELLTQRFLALLARVDAPEEVLALTFTRKAAGEMRNRVLAALDRAAAGPAPGEAPHQRLTRELGIAVLETDRARGWELRRNPARLRILTLDALCASLARRMPVLSGFGASPRVVEDAEPLYHEAARQTIDEIESGERWSDAVAHLLAHLDNHLPTVEGLIARMLAQRDQWLRHLMTVDRAALERTLAEVVGDALAALRAAVPADVAGEMTALLHYAAQHLARAGETPAMLAALERNALPGADPADTAAWREVAGVLLTDKGEWRARVTKDNGFPPAGNGADATEKARFKDMKERMQALLARLGAEDDLRLRLVEARELPPPRYSEAQWETVDALSQLLHLATGMLEVIFREQGEVDFIRVAQAARAALGGEDSPTDLALLLDERIRHLLVDEFQDTSLGQYQLLERLTAGWTPGDGRTLFLVGDPMQSIYRFREAEVGLYLRARRDGIGGIRARAAAARRELSLAAGDHRLGQRGLRARAAGAGRHRERRGLVCARARASSRARRPRGDGASLHRQRCTRRGRRGAGTGAGGAEGGQGGHDCAAGAQSLAPRRVGAGAEDGRAALSRRRDRAPRSSPGDPGPDRAGLRADACRRPPVLARDPARAVVRPDAP